MIIKLLNFVLINIMWLVIALILAGVGYLLHWYIAPDSGIARALLVMLEIPVIISELYVIGYWCEDFLNKLRRLQHDWMSARDEKDAKLASDSLQV